MKKVIKTLLAIVPGFMLALAPIATTLSSCSKVVTLNLNEYINHEGLGCPILTVSKNEFLMNTDQEYILQIHTKD